MAEVPRAPKDASIQSVKFKDVAPGDVIATNFANTGRNATLTEAEATLKKLEEVDEGKPVKFYGHGDPGARGDLLQSSVQVRNKMEQDAKEKP